MRISVTVPGVGTRTHTEFVRVSHAPVEPYFRIARRGAADESLSYVETIGLKRSSRGGAAADVGLVSLDV